MADVDGEMEDFVYESDLELEEAFQKGLLKPGLNVVEEDNRKEVFNDVPRMKEVLAEMRLDLPWVERFDVVTGLAPVAPEMVVKLNEQEARREKLLKNQTKGQPILDISDDPVLNDFRREMIFHRQAQAAVLEGISRLKELGVPTRRPDDYFAQMAKSDEHMQKVREHLVRKQQIQQRSEKVRHIREQRKINKQLQMENRLKKVSEKKQLMEQVKKFRKKTRDNLDFLEERKQVRKAAGAFNRRAKAKRDYKDKKFGFGGKKRGTKANTKESAADMSEFRRPFKEAKGRQRAPLQASKRSMSNQRPGKNKHLGKNKRPGKSQRMKQKGNRRR